MTVLRPRARPVHRQRHYEGVLDGFAFLSNLDVKVMLTDNTTLVETERVENVQFTLTGAGTEASGTVTAGTAPAPARR